MRFPNRIYLIWQSGRLKTRTNRAVYHYLLARDLGQEYSPEEMDRMIAEGLDDIEAGKTIDGEEAFRQLRAYSAERRQHRT